MIEKPELNRVRVEFCQEGNTIGTTETYEGIEISLEFQSGEDGGPFYVIKTESGWSIDGVQDLKELFDRCKKILDKPKGKQK